MYFHVDVMQTSHKMGYLYSPFHFIFSQHFFLLLFCHLAFYVTLFFSLEMVSDKQQTEKKKIYLFIICDLHSHFLCSSVVFADVFNSIYSHFESDKETFTHRTERLIFLSNVFFFGSSQTTELCLFILRSFFYGWIVVMVVLQKRV